MTDVPPGNGSAQAIPPAIRAPFPIVRLLYAALFAVVAWFVFWALLAVGAVQFFMVAISGRPNEELRNFALNLGEYLSELLAFITFGRDEQPFPVGPFPKHS
jgi:uncharacterized protein DUF4389